MNWNDLKVFLAVAHSGSLRGAAGRTGLSLSTVSRRIDALEDNLGVRLFDRRPDGYSLTKAGTDILADVEALEHRTTAIEHKVSRRDRRAAGPVRVSLPDALITHLLAQDLKTFQAAQPAIDLQLTTTYELADIMRGEADIALRFANDPGDQLVGRKLPGFYDSYYASRDYLDAHDLHDPAAGAGWIGYHDMPHTFPHEVLSVPYPALPITLSINSLPARVAACKGGVGLAMLPCFVGDQEPELVRITNAPPVLPAETWILVHPALHKAERARVVMDFFVAALLAKRDLVEGRCALDQPSAHSA